MSPRMLFRSVGLSLLLGALAGVVVAQQEPPAQPTQPSPNQAQAKAVAREFEPADPGKPLECRISGPFTHGNLSVFLLHGPDRVQLKKYLTLPEALEKKLFVIHETQNVNRLEMENLSADAEVIILSGDLLKGGQQDRIAQFDLIVPPKSGKVPLPAYCVERTAPRWMSKLTEDNKSFKDSPGQVFSNSQKLAGRYYMSQGKVWDEVFKGQGALSTNAGVNVQAKESDSSLALTLKVKEVVEASNKYLKALAPILDGKTDVVGYAYAINGKMYAADVFGSNALFRKVWPRLIQANSIEAFADLQKDKKFAAATEQSVRDFLKNADEAKAKGRNLDQGLREILSDNDKARVLRFETHDPQQKGSFLRRNYLAY
jgi:hypothetical protein